MVSKFCYLVSKMVFTGPWPWSCCFSEAVSLQRRGIIQATLIPIKSAPVLLPLMSFLWLPCSQSKPQQQHLRMPCNDTRAEACLSLLAAAASMGQGPRKSARQWSQIGIMAKQYNYNVTWCTGPWPISLHCEQSGCKTVDTFYWATQPLHNDLFQRHNLIDLGQ